MKLVGMLLGAVAFFAVMGLSLLAVVEILFSRSERSRQMKKAFRPSGWPRVSDVSRREDEDGKSLPNDSRSFRGENEESKDH